MRDNLNIPNIEEIIKYKNILILGIGGGFDIYCGLPIYYELFHRYDKNVILANYSFTDINEIKNNSISKQHLYNLFEIEGVLEKSIYNPEGYLFESIAKYDNHYPIIYSIDKQGSIPTKKAIEHIIKLHDIDCILCVDGGIDSIFHGDERGCGTILEDTIVTSALYEINIKKYLFCIGLTTEIEEKLCNYTAFKRISEYYEDDAVIGVCSLTKNMECFNYFKTITEYVFNLPTHKKSHISSRIIPAVNGKFEGDIFHNFLMNLYFVFNFDKVISKNILRKDIIKTNTFIDGIIITQNREMLIERKPLNL